MGLELRRDIIVFLELKLTVKIYHFVDVLGVVLYFLLLASVVVVKFILLVVILRSVLLPNLLKIRLFIGRDMQVCVF